MLRNYFFINILLVVVVGLLGLKLYGAIFQQQELLPKQETDIAKKAEKKSVDVDTRPRGKNFDIIRTKNLFSPTRTSTESESVTGTVSANNPPKLFGTIILNNERTAILEDPDSKKTGNYHVNDKVSGFTISEILEDKVILLSGSDKITVRLREDKGIVSKKPPVARKPPKRPSTRRRKSTPSRQRRSRSTPRKNVKPSSPAEEELIREAIESLK